MPPRPLPIIAGTVRVSVTGTVNGIAPWANVVHLRYAAGASAPAGVEIAAAHAIFQRLYGGTAYGAGFPWLQGCRTDTTATTFNYTPLDGASVTTSFSPNLAGTNSTAAAPSEVALVLSLHTAHRGKRYRGRVFLPAQVTTSFAANGSLLPGAATQLLTQVNGVQTALQAAQWSIVVASYGYSLTKAGPVTWTPFATDVTTFTMDTTPDVQRRRKH